MEIPLKVTTPVSIPPKTRRKENQPGIALPDHDVIVVIRSGHGVPSGTHGRSAIRSCRNGALIRFRDVTKIYPLLGAMSLPWTGSPWTSGRETSLPLWGHPARKIHPLKPHGLPGHTYLRRPLHQGPNIRGMNDEELTTLRRDHIGFIFQQFNLLPLLTAFENVHTRHPEDRHAGGMPGPLPRCACRHGSR